MTDDELRAWDWPAELRRQDRTVIWLARRTGTAYRTAYRYRAGDQPPTIEFLRSAAAILGVSHDR